FWAQAERITADFQQRLQQASDTASRSAAEKAYSQLLEFQIFTKTISDLQAGASDPTTVLKHHGLTRQGTAVYVLTSGRWQASFQVDKANHICTALSIAEVSPV